MNVLLIDTESFPAHANFNRIHISALLKVGCDVDCVFRCGYSHILNINNLKIVYEIPDSDYEKKDTRIKGRILMLKRLLDVKRNVNFASYDRIILSYYDETVLPFAFYPSKMYLINHINIGGLKYWIKRTLFKRISKNNTQIVLSKDAFDYIGKLGIVNRQLVYHGLPKTYNKSELRSSFIDKHYCIFSPSAQSSDIESIKNLLNSERFISYLIENNVEFIIRTKQELPNKPNVKLITSYMSDEDYQNCFVKSDIILVLYKKQFMYRVSAVLLECISNNKKVVIQNHPGLQEYKSIFGKDSFFDNVEGAISAIDRLLKDNKQPMYDKYNFEPDYSFLLN